MGADRGGGCFDNHGGRGGSLDDRMTSRCDGVRRGADRRGSINTFTYVSLFFNRMLLE